MDCARPGSRRSRPSTRRAPAASADCTALAHDSGKDSGGRRQALARHGKTLAANAARRGLEYVPRPIMRRLAEQRHQRWLDMQISTAPLDAGAAALMPAALKERYGDALPRLIQGAPRVGVWSGPAGGALGGMAAALASSPAAYEPSLRKLKRPDDLVLSVLRAFGDRSTDGAAIVGAIAALGQGPMDFAGPLVIASHEDGKIGRVPVLNPHRARKHKHIDLQSQKRCVQFRQFSLIGFRVFFLGHVGQFFQF